MSNSLSLILTACSHDHALLVTLELTKTIRTLAIWHDYITAKPPTKTCTRHRLSSGVSYFLILMTITKMGNSGNDKLSSRYETDPEIGCR